MASSRKKTPLQKDKLPNLKICVDNTDDLSSSSSESSEEGEISDDEQAIYVEAASSRKPEPEEKPPIIPVNVEPTRKLASPVQSDEETDLNVDLDDLETFGVTQPKNKRKDVEEKSESFELGFDPSSKESVEKRKERAKRFGIDCVTNIQHYSDDDVKRLYESLGVATESSREERGISMDTVHMRGMDELESNDIFAYFAIHPPTRVDWIDSSSCNVTWSESMSAARAVLCMSDDPSTALPGNTQNAQTSAKNLAQTQDAKDDNKEHRADDTMDADSDPDDLDLLSSDDEEGQDKGHRKKTRKSDKKETPKDQDEMETEDKPKETATQDSEEKRTEHLRCAYRIKPPGRWRVGRPLPDNKFIFMRFATQADGKPGFGFGARGGFARGGGGSFRGNYHNRLEAAIRRRTAEVEEEAANILARERIKKIQASKKRPLPKDDISDEDDGEPHERLPRVTLRHDREREFQQRDRDLRQRVHHMESRGGYGHRRAPPPPERQYSHPLHDDRVYYDEEEEEEAEEYERPRPQVRLEDIRIRRRMSDSEGEEELDMQAELDELLRHELPEKRKMRMYADDEEDLMMRKRMHADQVAARRHNEDQKDALRGRLGNNAETEIVLSPSRNARRRRNDRERERHRKSREEERERSRSPLEQRQQRGGGRKYEKLTIQVDMDDV